MPPLPRKPQQIYINRDIDFTIENYIENETPKLLFLHGQGGVGKSTLLKKFLSYDAKKIPIVLINLKDRNIDNFVDILLDRNISTIKNCKNFEKCREMIFTEAKLFAPILEAYGAETAKQLKEIEQIDENYGLVAKTIVDIFKLISKFFKRKYEAEKKELLNNIEFALISALKKDFKKHGLFIIDTFEKIKNNNIKSKIEFEDNNLHKSHKEKNLMLRHYVEGLVNLFVKSSTFIVAGRNTQDELNMEVPLDYTDKLSLGNFSFPNIKELFSLYVQRDKKLSMPSDKHIEQIKELTNGNPLIVGLFPKVAREYDSWEELDYKEMERRIKTDDKFSLLFYMTDRVLSHLEESKEVWKLVIPRVLNAEIEKLLFKDEKILKELIEVGLATKGTGKESERYYLHDDVHRAIVAYYEREFKNGFSSWHDAKVVADLHRELMGFYEKYTELYGVNSAFEGCYHKMMLREGFEREFEVSREEFSYMLLGSISLNYKSKIEFCSSFDMLFSCLCTEGIIKLFKEEKDKWSNWTSRELYSKLIKASKEGMSEQIIDDIPFLESLKEEFKEDWSLYSLIGSAYSNKGEYDKAIKSYQKSIELNSQKDEVYYDMGISYGKQGKYDKAIEAYAKAIEINPKKQEAYYNMGISYGKQGEYDKAIEAYEKAIEINPKNDNFYYNIGSAYSNKGEYDKAINAYQKAIQINHKEDVYSGMGIAYGKKGEYDNAIEAFQKAIEINPKDDTYNTMGTAYYYKGEYEKAIEAYQKALEINPKNDISNNNIVSAYYALRQFDKAININPNNNSTYTNLFELQLTQKQPFDQALEKKYIELFQKKKESFIAYEMLKILQNITHKKEAKLEQWKKNYEGVSMGSWSFDELEAWIDGVEESDLKIRLQEALEVFKGHG